MFSSRTKKTVMLTVVGLPWDGYLKIPIKKDLLVVATCEIQKEETFFFKKIINYE